MSKRVPKFRRILPQERRDRLVRATLTCLAAHGGAGASVRRIAAEAGVSPGLINHHYRSVEQLIADAYRSVADGLLREIMSRVAAADPHPRARLQAFVEASFSPLVLDPELLKIWVAFWSMVLHSAELRRIQQATWSDYREELERQFRSLAEAHGLTGFDPRRAALGLSALLDGLWLEWCLDPSSFLPAEGVDLCMAWIDGETGAADRQD